MEREAPAPHSFFKEVELELRAPCGLTVRKIPTFYLLLFVFWPTLTAQPPFGDQTMSAHKLKESEIIEQLQTIPGWSLKNGKLHRQLEFASFLDAFAFMTKAAIISEKKDHHPEWFNVYNKVTIDLTTHEFQGISTRDFEWAQAINQLLIIT